MDTGKEWSEENPVGTAVKLKNRSVQGKVVSEAFHVPGRHHVLVELEDGSRHAIPIEVLEKCEDSLPNVKHIRR